MVICTNNSENISALGFEESNKDKGPHVILLFDPIVQTVWAKVNKIVNGSPLQVKESKINNLVQ